MSDEPKFSRLTVVADCNLLAECSGGCEDDFDKTIIWVGADGLLVDGPIQKKANVIAQYLHMNRARSNHEGEFVVDALVREVARLPASRLDERFVRALRRDGFTLNEDGELKAMLPDVADLPQADDEVHLLLDELGMTGAKGHLDQAIDNHARGQFALAKYRYNPASDKLQRIG